MMALPFNLGALVAKAVPEAAESVRGLPDDVMCRLLFGESSGRDIGTYPSRSRDLAGGRRSPPA